MSKHTQEISENSQAHDAQKIVFGRALRKTHFSFAPSFTPLNHGSFGATPRAIEEIHFAIQRQVSERPDVFIVHKLPHLLDESRNAIAPLLGIDADEVVFVPNATTGVNTVLRNIRFEEGDVIVHFNTIYDSCEATIASIAELTPLRAASIPLKYPVEDDIIIKIFKEKVLQERKEGKKVKIAIFDTVLTFPGVRVPWEDLVTVCKEMGVLSLVDGAHGIGHIDLTHLGTVSPDFFVSNCHKWLFVPRGCAFLYVPVRNQHLIRTTFPTSYAYFDHSEPPDPMGKPQFINLFDFVATMDHTPYTCVPAAIKFRKDLGGEETIRKYCWDIVSQGGQRLAEILGTLVMDNKTGTLSQCCFANVRLPLTLKRNNEEKEEGLSTNDAGKVKRWLNLTAYEEFDTYLQIGLYAGSMWVRLSGQIYLGLEDFEWVGYKLKGLCDKLNNDPGLID